MSKFPLSKIPGKCFTRLEQWFGRNHLNPLLTLYANLRLLPLGQALKFPIYIYGWAHLTDLSGSVHFHCPLSPGLVRMNVVDLTPGQRGSSLELAIPGSVHFYGKALIRSNTKIYVDHGAQLHIGHNLRLGARIIINCLNRIDIGEGVRIGHGSQLLDSNLHYILNLNTLSVAPLKKRISISDKCWLTNTVTVYGGALIPPGSIVTSGSVVNKDLSALGRDNIIGGIPCKLIAKGMRLVNNYGRERELTEYFRSHPHTPFQLQSPLNENEWFDNP